MPEQPDSLAATAGTDSIREGASTANTGSVPKSIDGVASKTRKQTFKPGLFLNQGRQVVKGFSITKDQLDNLASTGWLTTSFFSFGTGLLGFAVNLRSTLDLSAGVERTTAAWWSGINVAAIVGALILYALGALFFFRGKSQKQAILDNTKFEGDDQA
jgi:hypothetical protein